MVAGDQQLVHTPFVPSGYWSPCVPFVWNEGFPIPLDRLSMSTKIVKAPDIRFLSSQFGKQHPCHEKAVSRTSLSEAIYACSCESISRGRADSPLSWPYQGIWGGVDCSGCGRWREAVKCATGGRTSDVGGLAGRWSAGVERRGSWMNVRF
ncbi:unnamed protein product [Schistosoma curassoni]|uniref:Uncharacterized protein n=1 Tax=Schistosoma curassoni TaxID=6186 RepID=A0A183JZ90_9TREM|nr:unnamed protein product [Schistosoma curassoni]